MLAHHVVDRLYRSVRALRIYEGTTEIQRLAVAGILIDRARAGLEPTRRRSSDLEPREPRPSMADPGGPGHSTPEPGERGASDS